MTVYNPGPAPAGHLWVCVPEAAYPAVLEALVGHRAAGASPLPNIRLTGFGRHSGRRVGTTVHQLGPDGKTTCGLTPPPGSVPTDDPVYRCRVCSGKRASRRWAA